MVGTSKGRPYRLDDRYTMDDGRVFMSGSQALARLVVEQLRVDRRHGWRTAAFVSGYPGSPLAGYDGDIAAAAAAASADGLDLVFRPALNEELAATAVMGSQLATTVGGCRYDGVIGVWYGKAPGLDRASDAMRHGVFAGVSPRGGAIALVGDDPAAKSSTLPSSSDANIVDLHLPLLYPGDVQEALDLGRHAIAVSRVSGLWAALKVVAAVADGTGTVDLHPDRIVPHVPDFDLGGRPFVPHPDGRLVTPYTLELEREFLEVRLPLAQKYGVVNHLNTISVRTDSDWIGIASSGHTYHETLEALRLLGLGTAEELRAAGIRLLKLSMPIPLDPAIVREFASGLSEILVVEEKNPTLEWLIKDALYPLAQRPVITGKRDPDDLALIPLSGAIDADAIIGAIRSRLARRLGPERLAPLPRKHRPRIPLQVSRTPYFCSGCPHSTSTRVPDGTLVGGGIGCHSMVMFMEEQQVGHLTSLTAMGNEGAQWIGMAPFVEQNHLVQNLGDGTLFHSGLLALRAAVASGVNITYKILFNGAVAMTGGQDPVGAMPVPRLVEVLLAEGVQQVMVTTDDTKRYRRVSLPTGVAVWDRSRLIEAQERLAAVRGTTVLIHDQRCAAELRRDRKRKRVPEPDRRVLINERVCEGCGDCGEKSNCLSVQPVQTVFGRKTRIDQTSCNFDYSCVQGDCPSFAYVRPARRSRGRTNVPSGPVSSGATSAAGAGSLESLLLSIGPPAPALVPVQEFSVRLSGIGGTGVVTVSQILGTAAMFDGLEVRGLDQTGLSQKAGPVVSDVRLSRRGVPASNKSGAAMVDSFIALDLLVAASENHLAGASPERTVVVGSSSPTPTGKMVIHPYLAYPAGAALEGRVGEVSRAAHNRFVDAAALCRALLGDASGANVLVLGVAVQCGALPVQPDSVERAIALNGVAVANNVRAFRLGRAWAEQPERVEATLAVGQVPQRAQEQDLVEFFCDDLVAYADRAYADRYRAVVRAVVEREEAVAPGSTALRDVVARELHHFMAYKDEYEVARLLLSPSAREQAEVVGGPGARVEWMLHPPLLRALGVDRKIRLGRWATPLFVLLRAMKPLRGRWIDPFGRAEVRKVERRLIDTYIVAVQQLLAGLSKDSLHEAVAIASLASRVRGYEQIKLRHAAHFERDLADRLARYGARVSAR